MNAGLILPSGARFFGYVADHARNRISQASSAEYLRTVKAGLIASKASTRAYWEPINDQGRSGHCGGAGTSQLVYTAMGCAGTPLSFYPSQRLTYAVTRALARVVHADGTVDPLEDTGVMPTDLTVDVSTVGVAPMVVQATPDGRFDDVWSADDCDPTLNPPTVNLEPDFQRIEEAGQTLITGEYRIDETSPDAYDHLCAILSTPAPGAPSGVPTGVGMFVDTAFMSWTPNMPPIDSIDLRDPEGGGHWLMDGEYETVGTGGARVHTLTNSWGLGYGDAGCVRITEKALRQAVSDLIPWTVRAGRLARTLAHARHRLTWARQP